MKTTSGASRTKNNGPAPGLVIGLTGGIASGKSTVSALLSELGAEVICADALAREVVAPGTAGLAAVVAHFGTDILDADGALNRDKLADRVFSDPAQRRALEALLHPRIRQEFARRVKKIRASTPEKTIVYDAPLLIEAGAHKQMDRVLVVAVDKATQIKRLIDRDQMSENEAIQRIDAQLTPEARRAHADQVIDGTRPPRALKKTLKTMLSDWSENRS